MRISGIVQVRQDVNGRFGFYQAPTRMRVNRANNYRKLSRCKHNRDRQLAARYLLKCSTIYMFGLRHDNAWDGAKKVTCTTTLEFQNFARRVQTRTRPGSQPLLEILQDGTIFI